MKNTRASIVTFCAALTSICDGRVRVVCDGRACTDGTTIYLPRADQIATADGQNVIYGIACHEAAHIYFDTPDRYQQFIRSQKSSQRALAADCYNAVADIADESRFERCFRLAQRYLTASTTHAAVSLIVFEDGNLTKPRIFLNSMQDVMVAAMLQTRSDRIQDISAKYSLETATVQNAPVRKAVSVLRKSLSRSRKGLRKRQRRDWDRLAGLAEQLMVILAESGLPSDSPSSFPPDQEALAAEVGRQANEQPACGASESSDTNDTRDGDPKDKNSEFVAPSLGMEGAGGGGALAKVRRAIISEVTDGQVGEIAPVAPLTLPAEILLAANPAVKASFRRHAKLLLQAPTPIASMPSFSGSKIGDLSRWRIDGKVLLRRAMQPDVGTAVAIALDCSCSMDRELAHVGTTASHLANALHEAGGNIACWFYGDDVVGVTLKRLHQVRLLGGTRTDLAVAAGRNWLSQQSESRKILCVFTDGAPQRDHLCVEEVKLCRRFGVKILVGAVNCSAQRLHKSMPGAELFEVGSNLEVGFHQAVRRIAR